MQHSLLKWNFNYEKLEIIEKEIKGELLKTFSKLL